MLNYQFAEKLSFLGKLIGSKRGLYGIPIKAIPAQKHIP